VKIDKHPYAIRKPINYVASRLGDLVQVDGDSEFQAASEEECQRRNIKLFVPSFRLPKLNGCIDRIRWKQKQREEVMRH